MIVRWTRPIAASKGAVWMWGGEAEQILAQGPWRIAAADMFLAGAIDGEVFTAGSAAGDVFLAGAEEGEVHG